VRILVIGDVFGRVGRRVLRQGLNNIVTSAKIDFVVANGENLAGGSGVTHDTLEEVFGLGVDVITSGNHIWDKKESLKLLETEKRLLRPANYPAEAPGVGGRTYEARNGRTIAVLNLLGRVFMDSVDCPFHTADNQIHKLKNESKIILVDMHAEATSEKQAMGHYLDGRVSAIFGTHTHVQTSDAYIMPRSTAYITDVGMTGPIHSIIGVRPEIILRRFVKKIPERFQEASGPGQFNGAVIEVNDDSGLAKSIKSVVISYEEQ
jgi:hypothetical protein|tara:strand:- start:70736 stop:71524 length:789 start_codon:yes stop_codon:yes gene_type:complete